MQEPQIAKSPVHHLVILCAIPSRYKRRHCHTCALNTESPNIVQILRSMFVSGISPNIRYPAVVGHWVTTVFVVEALEPILYKRQLSKTPIISPWRYILARFFTLLCFSHRGAVPTIIWDELQVWFEFGAEIPSEVLLVPGTPEYNPDLGFFDFTIGLHYTGEKPIYHIFTLSVGRQPLSEPCRRYCRTIRSTTMTSLVR